MKRTFNFKTGFLLFLVALPAPAQLRDDPSVRRFEVATIKPSRPDATAQDLRISFPPGRIEAINITLRELIQSFFGFSASAKIEGGPGWIQSERYDIIAKAEGPIADADRGPMLAALLKDRFKLITHQELREGSGLALTPGKNPPDLEPAKEGETTQITGNRRHLVFQNVNMPRVTNYLSQILGSTVEDLTGMKGGFDFAVDPEAFAIDPSENYADLLRASIGHLGFILESKKVMLRITVIDNVERPSEN